MESRPTDESPIDAGGPISVLALVPYPLDSAPSQRFRIEQWAPHLAAEGISVAIVPFADRRLLELLYQPGRRWAKAGVLARAFGRRLGTLAAATRFDAVLIHRAACLAGPAFVERALRGLGCRLIYDFDDAIFRLHATETNRRFAWLKFPGKTAAICRMSRHVVVGNTFLADFARRHNTNVTIIPSSIDTERYRPVEHTDQHTTVVIGWTGSSTSQTHLEAFAPVLRELLKCRPIEIRVISNREVQLPGVPAVWRPWSAETEVAEVSAFDIGIMPMPDDEWSRGKCAMKALQCMALGVPTVAAAVGANLEVIQDGENGLLANSPEEWLRGLTRLIDDAALRRRLATEARRTVEERFSMRHCAALFGNVVRRVVDRPVVTGAQ